MELADTTCRLIPVMYGIGEVRAITTDVGISSRDNVHYDVLNLVAQCCSSYVGCWEPLGPSQRT